MTAPIAAPSVAETLASYQQDVIYVRNTQPGPTVFTTDATRSDGHVTWQGANDPNGGDVQVVPRTLLGSVQFQHSLQLGIFQIVQDSATGQQALEQHQAAWEAAQERRNNADPEAVFQDPTMAGEHQAVVIDKASGTNDMQVSDCLGPNCDQRIPQTAKQVGTEPPLCKGHGALKGLFLAVEDHESPLINGKAPVKWVKTTVGRA